MVDPPALAWLTMLFGRAAGHVEVRYLPRRLNGKPIAAAKMQREFHPITPLRLTTLAGLCSHLAPNADVWVGTAPRVEQLRGKGAGGKANVGEAWALWADCDTEESVKLLADFTPEPTMVIGSGSGSNCHAYWSLSSAIPADWVEMANRRLAAALRADPKCAERARILRPPGTLNFKHDPPSPVEVLYSTGIEHPFSFVADLPEVIAERKVQRTYSRTVADDELLGISALEYVPRMSGNDADGRGFATCPLHEDWDPSLMCYEDPDRGWHCFQCGEGGDIYKLGSLLWNLDMRAEFPEIKRRLKGMFL